MHTKKPLFLMEVILNKKIVGTLLGFMMGFFMLHPASMVFQGLIHPDVSIKLTRIVEAFNVHHIPMAIFFGALGALFGFMNISYTLSLSKEKTRVRMLESLLPICAHCKNIRDDSGTKKGEGNWVRVDHYISAKTDTEFTHGMCPECFEGFMKELDSEEVKTNLHIHETIKA